MAASQTSCGTCGTEPRPGARFCDACGSPIADTGVQTEHKQVTVLFADVVRSMDLAGRLDSERLREVMIELFNRCGAIVQRYGGTVDKFTGDGIMAIFGAPIALEDHAARACLAALEIQREAGRLASDVYRRDGLDYALRVGLNSGEVVTGQIGIDPTSYTAVGAHVGIHRPPRRAHRGIGRAADARDQRFGITRPGATSARHASKTLAATGTRIRAGGT